jgi:hypothetical protein
MKIYKLYDSKSHHYYVSEEQAVTSLISSQIKDNKMYVPGNS